MTFRPGKIMSVMMAVLLVLSGCAANQNHTAGGLDTETEKTTASDEEQMQTPAENMSAASSEETADLTEDEEGSALPETGTYTLSVSESSVPAEYLEPVSNTSDQGRVERVDYETQDYVNGGNITKTVFVYLLAGYDDPENASRR